MTAIKVTNGTVEIVSEGPAALIAIADAVAGCSVQGVDELSPSEQPKLS